MINKKKTGLCLALAATLIASSALCGCQQSDSSKSAKFNSDVKDASKYTADENAQHCVCLNQVGAVRLFCV